MLRRLARIPRFSAPTSVVFRSRSVAEWRPSCASSLLRCKSTYTSLDSTPSEGSAAEILEDTPAAPWAALDGPASSSVMNNSHSRLLDTLAFIPKQVNSVQKLALEEDTYQVEADIAQRRSGMYYRQIKIEEEQMTDAVNSYTESLNALLKMGKGTNMKFIQKILLEWYEPLSVALTQEIKAVKQREVAADRAAIGPILLLLPVEKLAVLTLNITLNGVLRSGNAGVRLNNLAMQVGQFVESEVNINKLKMGKGKLQGWQADLIKQAYANEKKARAIGNRIRVLLDEEAWSSSLKIKLGSHLISILVDVAKHNDEPVFIHSNWFSQLKQKRVRLLQLNEETFKAIAQREMQTVLPRYLPMIVPPKTWNNKRNTGCYFRLKAPLMRTYNRSQTDAIRRADMTGILEGLDYLGNVPWKINKEIFKILEEALDRGIKVGELTSTKNVDLPNPLDCYSRPSQMFERKNAGKQKKKKKKGNTELDAVNEAINVEEAAAAALAANVDNLPILEDQIDIDADAMEEEPEDTGPDEPVFDERLYLEMCRRVKLKNAEMHSLRCDTQLKYWVAEKFMDDAIYFPTNLDFRGRAYPIPPNLSHLGSDLCRGLLTFAEKKPLGEAGFFWLKVHLSNLFGNNKISFDERAVWVDEHLPRIYDSVNKPLDGDRYWDTAEEPFQALAAMYEIVNAIESGDPTTYECSLPIHQDGSCNGLQHYAALGRDYSGGMAVNLTPNSEPQDVYTRVLDIVLMKMQNDEKIPAEVGVEYYNENTAYKLGKEVYDAQEGPKLTTEADVKNGILARQLSGYVARKVIKQTVMTSVYGVTRIGARAQIQSRLEEKIYRNRIMTPELDRELFDASRYLADLTLNSLEEMFAGAKEIMDWLGNCSHLIAKAGHVMSWVTPMGLPVMQPYRQMASHTVRTTMQSITLSIEDEALPVNSSKQRSAFPPNYVHSLDATHMLMTCLRMKDQNLTYASVHDSYWTHPCDIPVMSKLIRECFVELYGGPVLEDLRDSLVMRYPEIDFPPVPETGTLELNEVLDSKYFFH